MIERKDIAISGFDWLIKSISYDYTSFKYLKVEVLKKQIASELKIEEKDFDLNIDLKKKISEIIYKDKLVITKFSNPPNDIFFHLNYPKKDVNLAGKKGINITLNDISTYFIQNGIYYSKALLDEHVAFRLSNVKRDQGRIVCFNVDVTLDTNNIVNIGYHNNSFVFQNQEKISIAREEIKKALKILGASSDCNVIIRDAEENKILEQNFKLQKNRKYSIECINSFYFAFEKHSVKIKGDLYLDVETAKNMIYSILNDNKKLSSGIISLKADQIELDNNKQSVITIKKDIKIDVSKQSDDLSHPNEKVVYRDAVMPDIKIIFISEDTSEQKFDSFTESYPINTTIETLAKNIGGKFKIPKELKANIMYKEGDNKIIVDTKMNLEDIQEEMKQPDRTPENVLYVDFKKRPPKKKIDYIPKIIHITDNNQSNEPSQKPIKNHQVQPEKTIKQQDEKKKQRQQPKSTKQQQKPVNEAPKSSKYTFQYDGNKETIQLQKDLILNDQIKQIKNLFNLSDSVNLEFKIDDTVVDVNKQMGSFKDEQIFDISIAAKPNVYLFQTNKSDDICSIELPPDATVKDLKIAIARDNKVSNLANVKILFAGKDLLSDLILDELKVNDTILFVYIRSTEEVLLMSAKALQVDEDIYDFEEEEEEEDK